MENLVTFEFKTLNLRNGLKLDYKTQLTEIIRSVAPLDPRARPSVDSLISNDRGREAG